MTLSKRMNIEPSATLTINSLALAKRSKGELVHNLSAGEPMIDTPSVIIDAAADAMREGKTHYSPVAGILALRESASSWLNRNWQSNYSSNETFITNGGKFALYALCQALLEEKDEALIITPYWVSYNAMVKLAGATPVFVETKEEAAWKVTVEQLEAARTERTKLLFFNNASNPTGVLYTKAEVGKILAWAAEHHILVISDEVYSGLVYDGDYPSAALFTEYKDNTIIVQSCSKNFAMTGWRIGLVFAQEVIIAALKKIQGQSTSNTTTFGQHAAVVAYEQAEVFSANIREEMERRRDVFVNTWNELFDQQITAPQAGLYCFVSLAAMGSTETNDVSFCQQVLEEANVAMVPGAAFAAPGYVRMSFGLDPDDTKAALRVLSAYLNR